ncbi:MAG: type III-A CRISPR-associated RAMP protein Csm5 [candidate division KSB1 bacterium]|nr:type III-A CRISPR-associated RAMP protein Csm5 [candidate division KSB1 bacterium]
MTVKPEKKSFRLRTLTPVFVGSGEQVKPVAYYIDRENKKLHVLNFSKLMERLNKTQKDALLEYLESLIHAKKRGTEFSLNQFFENQNLLSADEQFIAKTRQYQLSFTHPPERLGFHACIKRIDHWPCIPGSEIKGAFRTAYLHYLLKNETKLFNEYQASLQELQKLMENSTDFNNRKIEKKFEKISEKLENSAFRGKNSDAKFDVLRFFQFQDTYAKPQYMRLEMTQSDLENPNTRVWLECIAPNAEMALYVTFFDIKEKYCGELGLQRFDDWSLDHFLTVCHERAKDVLEEESEFFKDKEEITALIENLKKENTPQTPLLRLGMGQGFLSTTINLLLAQKNEELYKNSIQQGLKKAWPNRYGKIRIGDFPKTRRVVIGADGRPTSLLGWVQIVPRQTVSNA